MPPQHPNCYPSSILIQKYIQDDFSRLIPQHDFRIIKAKCCHIYPNCYLYYDDFYIFRMITPTVILLVIHSRIIRMITPTVIFNIIYLLYNFAAVILTFSQLFSKFHGNQIYAFVQDDYSKVMPPLPQLLSQFYVNPDIAFFLAR